MYNYHDEPMYAADRCFRTIVSLGGEPCWFDEVRAQEGGGWVVTGREIRNLHAVVVPISEFDPTTRHVGYINDALGTREAHYFSRIPSRQWRQGIRPDNMVNLTSMSLYPKEELLCSEQFYLSYMDIYPSYKGSVISTISDYKSVSFHKEYRVHREDKLTLWNKWHCVGEINPNNFDVSLNKEFKFLEDELEEIIG